MNTKLLPSLCLLFLFGLLVAGCAKKEYHNAQYGFASDNQAVFDQQKAECEQQASAAHPAMMKPERPPYKYSACGEVGGRTTLPTGCSKPSAAQKKYDMEMMEYSASEDARQAAIKDCLNSKGWMLESEPAK